MSNSNLNLTTIPILPLTFLNQDLRDEVCHMRTEPWFGPHKVSVRAGKSLKEVTQQSIHTHTYTFLYF